MEYVKWVLNGFQTDEQRGRQNFIRRINEGRIMPAREYPLKKITLSSSYVYDDKLNRYCVTEQVPRQLFDRFRTLIKENVINEYFIGGSYALKRYTNAEWESNDIDIFIQYNKHSPRNAKDELEIDLGIPDLEVTRVWHRDRDPPHTDEEENFHDAIQQVTTYHTHDDKLKIQLVFIKDDYVLAYDKRLLNVLNTITDYPAHVFYHQDLFGSEFIFYTTELMDECIKHKIIPKSHCPHESRREKYRARGYTFV